jgi:hypothetical protein
MILSHAGLRPERECAGKDQQQQQITDPSSRQGGRYKITNPQLSKENFKEKEKLVTDPDGGLTPGRLTVGRKITLTLTLTTNRLESTMNSALTNATLEHGKSRQNQGHSCCMNGGLLPNHFLFAPRPLKVKTLENCQ